MAHPVVDQEKVLSAKVLPALDVADTESKLQLDLKDNSHHDIGHDLYQAALQMEPDERARTSRRVLWKLDLILLPMLCLVYLLGFLDKSALNYANAYGLKEDLYLQGTDYCMLLHKRYLCPAVNIQRSLDRLDFQLRVSSGRLSIHDPYAETSYWQICWLHDIPLGCIAKLLRGCKG